MLDDGWFGRRDNDNSSLGDWIVDRRKLPGRHRGARARRPRPRPRRSACGSSPRWSTPDSDLFRAHPDWAIGVPGRAADGEPPAARARLRAAGGRRPHRRRADRDVLASAPIDYVKWDMNRFITEPWTAAVPADRQGEFFHRYILGRVRPVPAADRALPRHPVRVVRERRRRGSTPGCWPGRRRPGRATTPTRSSGSRSSGARRSRSRCRRWRPTCPRCRTTRPGASRRCSRGPRWRCSAAFGYELDPTTMPADEQAEVARQIAWYRRAARRPPVRPVPAPAQPVRGRRQRDGLDGGRRGRRRTRSSASTACSRGPLPARNRLRLRGLDPAATYRGHDLDGLVRRRRSRPPTAPATS